MKNFRILLIGIISSLFLFGCGSKEIKKAKEYMSVNMYSDAISLLKIEIQDNPKNAEANFLLGKCYLKIDNSYDANKSFKRAILLETNYKEKIAKLYYTQSLQEFKNNNLHNAATLYQNALNYDPTGSKEFANELLKYANQIFTTNTNTDKIIQIYKSVVNIDPSLKEKVSDITYKHAKEFIEKNFIDDGFKYAKLSIINDPKHIKDVANLYFNYANKLLKRNNTNNEAISYFAEALKLNNDLSKTIADKYKMIASQCEGNNKIQDALFFAKKSAEIYPDYENFYNSTFGFHNSILNR